MGAKSVTWIALAAAAMVLMSLVSHARTIEGRIVGVHDGDAITVLDAQHQQHKIRLAGIDAPELKQAFGHKSKEHLSHLVYDRDVTLDCGKIDKYKREVCVIWIDGKDANRAQVEAGMAWWYRKYAKEQTAQQRADYEAAEGAAKGAKRGLWADAEPVPPWGWRRD